MIPHEAAIVRWARMERDGEPEGSLDDIIAQLKYRTGVPGDPRSSGCHAGS
jgi:hypothetical protein